jgi:hypothetical protein
MHGDRRWFLETQFSPEVYEELKTRHYGIRHIYFPCHPVVPFFGTKWKEAVFPQVLSLEITHLYDVVWAERVYKTIRGCKQLEKLALEASKSHRSAWNVSKPTVRSQSFWEYMLSQDNEMRQDDSQALLSVAELFLSELSLRGIQAIFDLGKITTLTLLSCTGISEALLYWAKHLRINLRSLRIRIDLEYVDDIDLFMRSFSGLREFFLDLGIYRSELAWEDLTYFMLESHSGTLEAFAIMVNEASSCGVVKMLRCNFDCPRLKGLGILSNLHALIEEDWDSSSFNWHYQLDPLSELEQLDSDGWIRRSDVGLLKSVRHLYVHDAHPRATKYTRFHHASILARASNNALRLIIMSVCHPPGLDYFLVERVTNIKGEVVAFVTRIDERFAWELEGGRPLVLDGYYWYISRL